MILAICIFLTDNELAAPNFTALMSLLPDFSLARHFVTRLHSLPLNSLPTPHPITYTWGTWGWWARRKKFPNGSSGSTLPKRFSLQRCAWKETQPQGWVGRRRRIPRPGQGPNKKAPWLRLGPVVARTSASGDPRQRGEGGETRKRRRWSRRGKGNSLF